MSAIRLVRSCSRANVLLETIDAIELRNSRESFSEARAKVMEWCERNFEISPVYLFDEYHFVNKEDAMLALLRFG